MDKIESFCIDMDSRKADYMVEQLQDFDISETRRALAHVDISAVNIIVGTSADKGRPIFEIKGFVNSIQGEFYFPESNSNIKLMLHFSENERPEVVYYYEIKEEEANVDMANLASKGYFRKDYSIESPATLAEKMMPLQTTIYKLNDETLKAPIFAVKIENAYSNTINKHSCGFDLVELAPVYNAPVASKANVYQIFSQPVAETVKAPKEQAPRKDNIHIIGKDETMSIEQAAQVSEQEMKEQRRRELFENSVALSNVDTYTETKNAILKAAEEKRLREEAEARAANEGKQASEGAIPDMVDDDEEAKKKKQLERNANISQAEAAGVDTGYSDTQEPTGPDV